jgi:hypothetical protein
LFYKEKKMDNETDVIVSPYSTIPISGVSGGQGGYLPVMMPQSHPHGIPHNYGAVSFARAFEVVFHKQYELINRLLDIALSGTGGGGTTPPPDPPTPPMAIRTYVQDLGDGLNSTFVVEHNFGSDMAISYPNLINRRSGDLTQPSYTILDENRLRVDFGGTPPEEKSLILVLFAFEKIEETTNPPCNP